MKRNFLKALKFIGVKSVLIIKQFKIHLQYWEWIIVRRFNTRRWRWIHGRGMDTRLNGYR